VRAWLRGLSLRLTAALRRRARDQDLEDEIAFHVAMREDQLRAAGTPDASRAARRRFGSAARIREEMRDQWAVLPRLAGFAQDCRYAARALRRSGTFAAVVVMTLALGIGANTAVFSIVNAVLIRPLGFADADRLVLLHEGVPSAGIDRVAFAYGDLAHLRRDARSFDGIGAFRNRAVELSGGSGDPERIQLTQVSAELFPMLGLHPAIGRQISPDEDTAGHDVALLSWPLWQRRYAGDPSVIGRSILLDRRAYTVVGVMPSGLRFPPRGPQFNGQPGDVWVPTGMRNAQLSYANGFDMSALGRLRPGVTMTQARAELDLLEPQIQAQYPPGLRNRARASLELFIDPLRDAIVGSVGTPILLLLGAIGLVLLVACANIANLLLSRAAARQHEMGLRVALGATRIRLLQLQLSEPLLLATVGGLLGVFVARLSLNAVPDVVADQIPGLHGVAIDLRVLGFTAVLSIATAVMVGLVPFAARERRPVSDVLQEGTTRATGQRRHRIQSILVVTTVALSFVLLVGAGLFLRSFSALLRTDRGFRPAGVLTAAVALPWEAYPTADRVDAFHDALQRRLESLPGVRRAALSSDLPLEGTTVGIYTLEGTVDGVLPPARHTSVGGAYFETLGIAVTRGRTFTPDELAGGRQVALVNEKLAQRYWPGQDPIGKRLKWGTAASRSPWISVVGVVEDAVDGRQALATLGDERPVHIYEPLRQIPRQSINSRGSLAGRELRLSVLTQGDPSALIGSLKRELADLDRQLALARIATMDAKVSETIAPQRFSTQVVTVFAAGALLLVSIGLYGLLAFVVSERTREIGVRLALGAEPHAVRRSMVKHGLQLAGVGVSIGFVAALGATRWLSSLLYGTGNYDPLTFVAVPVVLLLVATLACLIPAHRASRVDPLVALRGD
jgi:predicted permease